MSGHGYLPTWRTTRVGDRLVVLVYCAVCGEQHTAPLATVYTLRPRTDRVLEALAA